MRKIIILSILAIFLAGCWDLTESEKLGLVTIIGIDASDNGQLKVVLHEMSSQQQSSGGQQGGGTNKTSAGLIEVEAPTISAAVEKIASSDFHRIYLAHTGVIILSEEILRSKGIAPFIGFFERTPEIRRNVWLLVTPKGQFNKFFNSDVIGGSGVDKGKVIKEILRSRNQHSFITVTTLGEFLNLLWEKGSEPYTSGVKSGIATSQQDKSAGSAGTNSNDFSVGDTAVFKHNKLVGWMNEMDSKGIVWVRGGIKGGILPVNYDDKIISLRIVKMDSDVKPMIVGGKMRINIHIDVESRIAESQTDLDFARKETLSMIEDLQAKEIKKQINATIHKTKQLKSDVFGFGNYFFGKYPDYWKRLEAKKVDYYPKIGVNIDVNSKIDIIGLIKKREYELKLIE